MYIVPWNWNCRRLAFHMLEALIREYDLNDGEAP